MDISGDGLINAGYFDLPLDVVLNNTTINAFGGTLPVDDFPIQVQVLGTIDQPQLKIPMESMQQAIMSGGKKKIENMIKEEADDQLKNLFNRLGG
jgi:hypothetical protein